MSTKERFVEYLKIKGIGQTAFEESAGLSRGAIAKKTGFSADSIEKIASACPDLDINWLVTGEGEMMKSNLSKSPILPLRIKILKYLIYVYAQGMELGLTGMRTRLLDT